MGDRIVKLPDYPGGRERRYFKNSGEQWRDEVLLPALREGGEVTVDMREAAGMCTSFAEEAFAGAMRELGNDVRCRISLVGPAWRVQKAVEMMDRWERICAEDAP